ncbi:MAG: amidohydrolase [Acidobacteria bacterium]|nr:MAG: amidohydrolase [Acidobacteriota bacterium]
MSYPDYGVIDIHVHIQPWHMVTSGVVEVMQRTRTDLESLDEFMRNPDRFIQLMDEQGVEKAGLINYVSPDVMGFDDSVNEYSARYAQRYPDRLIPYGSVHPRFSKDPAADMDRIVHELGIKAIKIHPPHQLLYPNEYLHGLQGLAIIYEKAQEYGIPVMIHTGTSIFPKARNKYGDPMHVDDVAVDFPRLKIILAHAGRPLWMSTCLFLVRRHPNVYLDISSIPPAKLLEYCPWIERVAHKTMWGTDWPAPLVPSMRENVRQFYALPLSERAKRQILRETALKVFNLT